MFQFSRAIYRQIAADIIEDPHDPDQLRQHRHVIGACEDAVLRLAQDRQHFAKPAQSLFAAVRTRVPLAAQARTLRVIEQHLAVAGAFLDAQPASGYDINGASLQCRALTRAGAPCQRPPLPRNGYCPTHQHLAEPATLAA